MLTNSEIARSAREAANLIRTSGWFKSVDGYNPNVLGPVVRFPTFQNSKCFCPVTAMPPRGSSEVVERFARFLGYSGKPVESDVFVMSWNDSQESVEPVLLALEKFASYMDSYGEVKSV